MLAKLRAADSSPGVLDVIGDAEYYLVGGHEEDDLRGEPRDDRGSGETAPSAGRPPTERSGSRSCAGAAPACRAGRKTFKLPATLALRGRLDGVPQVPAPLMTPPGRAPTSRGSATARPAGVGYLEFCFPGGAMSTGQCRRLLAAYRHAQSRPVKVIVLGGPRDFFFANGIHLNVDPGRR